MGRTQAKNRHPLPKSQLLHVDGSATFAVEKDDQIRNAGQNSIRATCLQIFVADAQFEGVAGVLGVFNPARPGIKTRVLLETLSSEVRVWYEEIA